MIRQDRCKVVYPFFDPETNEGGYRTATWLEWEEMCRKWKLMEAHMIDEIVLAEYWEGQT